MSAIPNIVSQSSSDYSSFQNRAVDLERYARIHEIAKNGLEFIPFLQEDLDIQERVSRLIYDSGKFNSEEQERFGLLFIAAQRNALFFGDFYLTEKDIDLLNRIKKKILKQLNQDASNTISSINTPHQQTQIAAPRPRYFLSDDEFVGSPSIRSFSSFANDQNSSHSTSCARSVDLESPAPLQIGDALS